MKRKYEEIYFKLPVILQNVLVSAYGAKLKSIRYGSVYKISYLEYLNRQHESYEHEQELQLRQLKDLLLHAKANSLYYQNSLSNIDVEQINSIADLERLPILSKADLMQYIEDIKTCDPADGVVSSTGGTTGKSIQVVFRKEDFQRRLAYLDAFKAKVGVLKGDRKATFSGRKIVAKNEKYVFWRNNWSLNQRLYSTFDLQPDKLPAIVNDLNDYQPVAIDGFVSAIYICAKYILKNNIQLSFKPIAIFTTSETLLRHHRESIEAAFKCKLYNQYASAEGAPFICECSEGNLHYNLDTGVIETQRVGEDTEMLVTSFTSYGTPLIRYKIGDTVSFSSLKETCRCGSCHPLVESIGGRTVDYLYSPEKGRISLSHLADVIKGLPGSIDSMQFVQEKDMSICVNIVVDKNLYVDEHSTLILNEMRYRFGDEISITVQLVPKIELAESGKHRLILNNYVKSKSQSPS